MKKKTGQILAFYRVHYTFDVQRLCCNWLHCLELPKQAQAKDGNSGH